MSHDSRTAGRYHLQTRGLWSRKEGHHLCAKHGRRGRNNWEGIGFGFIGFRDNDNSWFGHRYKRGVEERTPGNPVIDDLVSAIYYYMMHLIQLRS